MPDRKLFIHMNCHRQRHQSILLTFHCRVHTYQNERAQWKYKTSHKPLICYLVVTWFGHNILINHKIKSLKIHNVYCASRLEKAFIFVWSFCSSVNWPYAQKCHIFSLSFLFPSLLVLCDRYCHISISYALCGVVTDGMRFCRVLIATRCSHVNGGPCPKKSDFLRVSLEMQLIFWLTLRVYLCTRFIKKAGSW